MKLDFASFSARRAFLETIFLWFEKLSASPLTRLEILLGLKIFYLTFSDDFQGSWEYVRIWKWWKGIGDLMCSHLDKSSIPKKKNHRASAALIEPRILKIYPADLGIHISSGRSSGAWKCFWRRCGHDFITTLAFVTEMHSNVTSLPNWNFWCCFCSGNKTSHNWADVKIRTVGKMQSWPQFI